MSETAWLDQIKWDANGLAPVITQDADSGRVLTLAWINRDALQLTQQEGRAVYWSRSRQKIWRKGEESGNVQRIRQILLDCDADAVVYQVEQVGGVACHTGRASCFYQQLTVAGKQCEWVVTDPVLKDPAAMYGQSAQNSRQSTRQTTK